MVSFQQSKASSASATGSIHDALLPPPMHIAANHYVLNMNADLEHLLELVNSDTNL
jgi:hypothetical protein